MEDQQTLLFPPSCFPNKKFEIFLGETTGTEVTFQRKKLCRVTKQDVD